MTPSLSMAQKLDPEPASLVWVLLSHASYHTTWAFPGKLCLTWKVPACLEVIICNSTGCCRVLDVKGSAARSIFFQTAAFCSGLHKTSPHLHTEEKPMEMSNDTCMGMPCSSCIQVPKCSSQRCFQAHIETQSSYSDSIPPAVLIPFHICLHPSAPNLAGHLQPAAWSRQDTGTQAAAQLIPHLSSKEQEFFFFLFKQTKLMRNAGLGKFWIFTKIFLMSGKLRMVVFEQVR